MQTMMGRKRIMQQQTISAANNEKSATPCRFSATSVMNSEHWPHFLNSYQIQNSFSCTLHFPVYIEEARCVFALGGGFIIFASYEQPTKERFNSRHKGK